MVEHLKEEILIKVFLLVLVFSCVSFFNSNTIIMASEIEIEQELSIGLGTFSGDRELYDLYNSGSVPSLSPQISSDLSFSGNLVISEDFNINFAFTENDDNHLGVDYKNFDLYTGEQMSRTSIYGFTYNQLIDGLSFGYKGDQLETRIFRAEKTSRYNEVEFYGDDSPGPYFLGNRDIIENTINVYVDGVSQTKGDGPNDGDYYIDYDGGFIYFNKIIYEEELIEVSYEFEYDGDQKGQIAGGNASFNYKDNNINILYLVDDLPIDEDSIFEERGYNNQLIGLGFTRTKDNYRWDNSLVYSDYSETLADSEQKTDKLEVGPDNQNEEFDLAEKPILYESDSVKIAGGDELERNLDYRIMYEEGKIIFNTSFQQEKIIEVTYKYIIDIEDYFSSSNTGINFGSNFQYESNDFESEISLDFYNDEYVDFRTRKVVDKDLLFSLDNRYSFNDNVTGIFNYSREDRSQEKETNSAVGVEYSRNRLNSNIELNRDIIDDYESEEYKNSIISGVGYEFRIFDFNSRFSHRVDDGLKLDRYNLSIEGDYNNIEYESEFKYGYSSHNKELQSSIDYNRRIFGIDFSAGVDNTLFYERDLSSYSRRVTILSSGARYLLDNYYFDGELSYRERVDDESNNYNTNFNLESNLTPADEIFINNQFEIKLENGLDNIDVSNQLIYSHDFKEFINVMAQLGGKYDNTNEDIITQEYNYSLDFNFDFDQYLLKLKLSESNIETEFSERIETENEQEVLVGINYDFNEIDLFSSLSVTRYDFKDVLFKINLKPSKQVNDEVEVWGEYEYQRMNSSNNEGYNSNEINFGVSYSL